MFELRWIERTVNTDHLAFGTATVERILQYRETDSVIDQDGSGYEMATEWRDVPVVTEP